MANTAKAADAVPAAATAADFFAGEINATTVGSALANGPETINTGATQLTIVDGVITVTGAIRAKNSNEGTFDGSARGPAIAQYLKIPTGSVSVEEFQIVNGVPSSLGVALLNTESGNPDAGWFDYTKGVFRMGVYLYSKDTDTLRNGDLTLEFVFKDANGIVKDINYTLRFGTTVAPATAPTLGLAGDYAVFANTGIHTDAGASSITGKIGTGPGITSAAITGFALTLPAASAFSTSAQVSGNVYAYDYANPTPANVNTASLNMGTAYTTAAGKTSTSACPTFTTGLTLGAGVYTCTTNVTIPTDITLNGSATDVWIFQIKGTLDMAAAKTVHLTGDALPQNVFWQVSDAVNIGANTHFEGNILGQTAITLGNLASINGRLLAQTAVNLDTNTIVNPSAPTPIIHKADFVAFDGVAIGTNSYTVSKDITATYTGNNTIKLTGYSPIITPWFMPGWTTYNYVTIGIKLPTGFSGNTVFSTGVMQYNDANPNGIYVMGDGTTPLATTGDALGYLDFSFGANKSYVKDGLVKLEVIWNANSAPEYYTIDVTGLQLQLTAEELAAALSNATAAVVKAEGSKLQADVNAAQTLVTALPDGTAKTDLQNRINAIQVTKKPNSSSGSRATPAVPATKIAGCVPGSGDLYDTTSGKSCTVRATPATPGQVLGASTQAGSVLGAEKFNFTKFLKFKAGSYKFSLQGAEVIELQKFLTTLGYDLGIADGKFGPLTEGAVIKFQIAKGLKGDGVVGALTREALNK